MKILFMGSPNFAVPALDLMLKNSYTPLAVYTSAPAFFGRGMKLKRSPVHEFALSYNIPVVTPLTLKDDNEVSAIKRSSPDVIVVVAYGIMIPSSILSIPTFGCLNVHPSLLPKWRGASPIQSAIMNGDKITGVSVIKLNNKLDSGPILLTKSIGISESDNYSTMHEKLSSIGAELMVEALRKLDRDGEISVIPQNDSEATYCGKIDNYQINWHENAASVCCKIRGLFPKAFFIHELGFRLRVLEAAVSPEIYNAQVGAIVGQDVVCHGGTAVRLKIVQKESGKPCLMRDFILGLR